MNNSVSRIAPLAACVLLFASCTTRRSLFRVVPAAPEYLLRSPDGVKTPFDEILRNYNGFVPGRDGMDLHPLMELRIENAYYERGKPKRGLNGFLGTEIARYRCEPHGGMKLLSLQSMPGRPPDQPPVDQLIGSAQQKFRYYHFYFEVLFRDESQTRGSVILGANSVDELRDLDTRLTADPGSVCNSSSTHCTVFPEACSVSVEMQIVVNGRTQSVLWRSRLASVAPNPRELKLLRLSRGKLFPVRLQVHDPNTLQLPLLPGDRISWR